MVLPTFGKNILSVESFPFDQKAGFVATNFFLDDFLHFEIFCSLFFVQRVLFFVKRLGHFPRWLDVSDRFPRVMMAGKRQVTYQRFE